MHKILAIFIVILLTTSVNANAKGVNIAVVDIQKVLQDSSAAKDIREKIKAQRDKYQADITAEEEKLRKEEAKLAEQSSILSKEAFEQKRVEFKEKLTKVQRDVQAKRSALDTSLANSLSHVQKVVFEIIGELAKDKGFNIAIPTSQILYAEENLNITADVLKMLNKRLPSVPDSK